MGWPSAVLQLIWKNEAVENDAIVVSTAQWYNSVLSAAVDHPGMSINFVRRCTKRVGMWHSDWSLLDWLLYWKLGEPAPPPRFSLLTPACARALARVSRAAWFCLNQPLRRLIGQSALLSASAGQ